VRVFIIVWHCTLVTSVVSKWRHFSFYLQSGKQKSRVGEGRHVSFGKKKSLVKKTCEVVRCRDATASSFVAKVRGEVFAHFHVFAIERHSSMRNWLLGLPRLILYERFHWCQGKWTACSWLCSSPVSLISISVSLDFPCTRHTFFPECLSNHYQGLDRTFLTFAQNLTPILWDKG
jgi:hypothetical protein